LELVLELVLGLALLPAGALAVIASGNKPPLLPEER